MNIPITTSAQQAAVLASRDVFNLIYGNAGSAKTTTLALKVMAALKLGMAPSAMQVLTYSAAAVRAFRERMSWMGAPKVVLAQLSVLTFNELCHAQLEALEGNTRYLAEPNREVFKTVLQAIEVAREQAQLMGWHTDFSIQGDGSLLVSSLLHKFRRLKGTMCLHVLGNEFVLTPASAEDVGADYTELAVLRAYERLRFGASSESVGEGDQERQEYRCESR